jgi:hypothetical protein
MTAIAEGKPPAVRPANCTEIVSQLWDLFEECWSKDPARRPDAAAICEWLEANMEQVQRSLSLE